MRILIPVYRFPLSDRLVLRQEGFPTTKIRQPQPSHILMGIPRAGTTVFFFTETRPMTYTLSSFVKLAAIGRRGRGSTGLGHLKGHAVYTTVTS